MIDFAFCSCRLEGLLKRMDFVTWQEVSGTAEYNPHVFASQPGFGYKTYAELAALLHYKGKHQAADSLREFAAKKWEEE